MNIQELTAAGPGQPVALTAWVKKAWPVKAFGRGTVQNLILHDGSGEVACQWRDPIGGSAAAESQQVQLSGGWGAAKNGVTPPTGAWTEVYENKFRIVAKEGALAVVGAPQPAAPAYPTAPPAFAPPAGSQGHPQGQYLGQRYPDPGWAAGAGLPPGQPAPQTASPAPPPQPPPRPVQMTEAEARSCLLRQWRLFEQTAGDVPAEVRGGWSTSIMIGIQQGKITQEVQNDSDIAF